MRFEKWQALGNDYLIVEREELPWELTAERIRRLCEPHFGVGSDGVLLLSPAADERHVAELRIFNPDGSEAELSGNGAREAVLYLRAAGWTDAETFSIITRGGRGDADDHRPEPRSRWRSDGPRPPRRTTRAGPRTARGTVRSAGRDWAFRHVNVGNPQCVIEVGDELEELDLGAIGPAIESNTELFPEPHQRVLHRASTGATVRARIFERGVGETLASGTGASGAAVAAFLDGAPSPLRVELDGGTLEVEVSDELDLTLTGSAERVYAGELDRDLVASLGA